MDFLGEGAADLCAGEFLVPLAAGKLFPPVQIKPEEVHYDSLKRCLIQMEELCEAKENAYELGVKAAVLQIYSSYKMYPSRESCLLRIGAVEEVLQESVLKAVRIFQ